MVAQIERVLSTGQLIPLQYSRHTVTADASIPMPVLETMDPVELVTVPFDGNIVGVSVALSTPGTTGQLTITPSVDGVAYAAGTVAATLGPLTASGRVARGQIPVKAGQEVGALIGTSVDWAPLAVDLVATLWLLLRLEEI